MFPFFPQPRRQPVHDLPVWLWDPELETYVLARDDVAWTEGPNPMPVVPPPERPEDV